RRPLPSPLLIRLAQVLEVDLRALGSGEDSRLLSDLVEVFADPLFAESAPTEDELRAMASTAPGIARAVVSLHQASSAAPASAPTPGAARLDRADLPQMAPQGLSSEQVSDFLQSHRNHFPELESAAERVRHGVGLEGEDLFGGLARYLEQHQRVAVKV